MAELATIARPYAEALFKASQSDLDGAAGWLDPLAAVAGDAQLLQLAANPNVRAEQVIGVITGVVKQPLPGPAMNFLLFLACAIPLHPAVGWLDPSAGVDGWTTMQTFLGAMAVLQFFSMVLNLVPIPPLDGFRAIAPYLPHQWREQVMHPQIGMFLFIVYFLGIGRIFPRLFGFFEEMLFRVGFDDATWFFRSAYRLALYGHA